jgi:hypothetical protein
MKKTIWVFPILALCVSVMACSLVSYVQNLVENGTISQSTGTVQIGENANDILSSFATQRAQFVQPSSTPISPTPSPSPTVTSTPITPTATNTQFILTPIPPTRTPTVMGNKLNFRQGGTSIYLQKPIKHGNQHYYSVRAMDGQTLILTVSSPNNDVYLGMKGIQDGQQLIWPTAQTSYWFGTLPKTQDYLISLTTQNPDTYYFLSVEIPANIHFQPGVYSATIDGFIDVDTFFHPDMMTRIRYLAKAFAGQTMTIDLNSADLDDLSLGIVGQQDGQVYIRYQVKNSGGEVYLPISQGYYLDVYSTGGKSTAFALEITIK